MKDQIEMPNLNPWWFYNFGNWFQISVANLLKKTILPRLKYVLRISVYQFKLYLPAFLLYRSDVTTAILKCPISKWLNEFKLNKGWSQELSSITIQKRPLLSKCYDFESKQWYLVEPTFLHSICGNDSTKLTTNTIREFIQNLVPLSKRLIIRLSFLRLPWFQIE